MQKLKELDDFDFDIDEYLPSNSSSARISQIEQQPSKTLLKQETQLDSMEDELFGKPLPKPAVTQPPKDSSTTSILATYQQPSTISVVTQSSFGSAKSFDTQVDDSNLPSFLKRDSNATRRRRRGDDKSSSVLRSQISSVLPPLKEVEKSQSQMSVMSHEDKVSQWAKWLKIKEDEGYLMEFAEKGAQLPVPYPWKEQVHLIQSYVTSGWNVCE